MAEADRPTTILSDRGHRLGGGENRGTGSKSGVSCFQRKIAESLWTRVAVKIAKQCKCSLSRNRQRAFFVPSSGAEDVDLAIFDIAEAVHSSQSLSHALEWREITDQMIGGNVDTTSPALVHTR